MVMSTPIVLVAAAPLIVVDAGQAASLESTSAMTTYHSISVDGGRSRRRGARRRVLSCRHGVGLELGDSFLFGSEYSSDPQPGGLIPELWDASVFPYTSVVFSGIDALAGFWIGCKLSN
jgi:hypothetical protein